MTVESLALAAECAMLRSEVVQARREWDEAHAYIAKQAAEIEQLKAAARIAADIEREECAALADEIKWGDPGYIGSAIRARGKP